MKNGNIPIVRMLKIALIYIISFGFFSDGFAQNWTWAEHAGGNDDDAGTGIVVDASGDIYITGFMRSSSITFGGIMYSNASYPQDDGIISKLDPAGNVLWLHGMHGTGRERGSKICMDPSENLFATGYSWSNPVFFSGSIYCQNNGQADYFLTKYDSAGNAIWARNGGGAANEYGNDICSDPAGNIYVAGNYSSTSLNAGGQSITNSGGDDFFLVKYDTDGNGKWVKGAGGSSQEKAYGICSDSEANLFVCGVFDSPSLDIDNITLNGTGTLDLFIAKYDSSGQVLWAKSAGSGGLDYANAVCSDDQGNVYMTGWFQDTIEFGNTTLIAQAYCDLFIVKYNPGGDVVWAVRAGGGSITQGKSISIDRSGNIFICGQISTHPTTFGSIVVPVVGGTDVFVLKCDTSGNFIWVRGAGCVNLDEALAVASDGNERVYTTGYHGHGVISFDSTQFTNNGNLQDLFVAAIDGLTGVDENLPLSDFAMHPNPASELIHLDLFDNVGMFTISLISITGQELIVQKFSPGVEAILDVRDIPNGIYLIRANLDEHALTRLITVQH